VRRDLRCLAGNPKLDIGTVLGFCTSRLFTPIVSLLNLLSDSLSNIAALSVDRRLSDRN
jgi:hypothetical protein